MGRYDLVLVGRSLTFCLQGTKLRFLDTMSMHIALGGMTGDQRMLYMARTKGSLRKEVREIQERAAKYREEMVRLDIPATCLSEQFTSLIMSLFPF